MFFKKWFASKKNKSSSEQLATDNMQVNKLSNYDLSSEQKLMTTSSFKKTAEKFTKENLHLIADDSEINRLVLRKYLGRIGEKFHEVTNGKEVLEIFDKHHFNFIWIDVKMPYLDGIQTTKQLRQRGYKWHVVGVTGQVDSDTQKECMAAGMTLVLAKPVLHQTIYTIIDQYSESKEDPKLETKIEETKVETKVEETKVEETKVEETKVEETKAEAKVENV